MTSIKRKIESCPICAAFHTSVKETFCELVKKLSPNINKNTCKALFDDLVLERKITKEELARRLGLSAEQADELFKIALQIADEALREVRGLRGERS